MQLLSSIACYNGSHAALVSAGGVLAVVNAVASNLGHGGVLRAGITLLGRIANKTEWCEAIVAAGGVEVILAGMGAGTAGAGSNDVEVETVERGLYLIDMICLVNGCRQTVADTGAKAGVTAVLGRYSLETSITESGITILQSLDSGAGGNENLLLASGRVREAVNKLQVRERDRHRGKNRLKNRLKSTNNVDWKMGHRFID